MASIRQLKKKINQQSFKVVKRMLSDVENQKNNTEKWITLIEESAHFAEVSLQRIQNVRNLSGAERRAELKSIGEQVRDKEVYFGK